MKEVIIPKFPNQRIEMKKLIIIINILLTFLLVGCTKTGVYIEEKKGGKYVKKLELKDCINIPEILLICY